MENWAVEKKWETSSHIFSITFPLLSGDMTTDLVAGNNTDL